MLEAEIVGLVMAGLLTALVACAATKKMVTPWGFSDLWQSFHAFETFEVILF